MDIHVVTVPDLSKEDQYEFLLTFVYSLSTRGLSNTEGTLHLLLRSDEYDQDFLVSKKIEIRKVAGNNLNVEFMEIPDDIWYACNLLVPSGLPNKIFVRFYLCELFPAIKRVLYADYDILFKGDITELFQMDLEDRYATGSQDGAQTIRKEYAPDLANAGFMLYDLEKLRDLGFSLKCFTYEHEKDPWFKDQATINAVLKGKIKFLDPTWNLVYGSRKYMSIEQFNAFHGTSFPSYNDAVEATRVIHFTGPWKPTDTKSKYTTNDHLGIRFWREINKEMHEVLSATKFLRIFLPNYNHEDTLDRCLKSIVSQKFQDINVLVYDDASTDKSLEIIKHYAKQAKNIQVVGGEYNVGIGAARRIMARCTDNGLYTISIDSDDWLSNPDSLGIIAKRIVETGFPDLIKFARFHGSARIHIPETHTLTEFTDECIKNGNGCVVTDKAIRSELFDKAVSNVESIYAEDVVIIAHLLNGLVQTAHAFDDPIFSVGVDYRRSLTRTVALYAERYLTGITRLFSIQPKTEHCKRIVEKFAKIAASDWTFSNGRNSKFHGKPFFS